MVLQFSLSHGCAEDQCGKGGFWEDFDMRVFGVPGFRALISSGNKGVGHYRCEE